MNSSLIISFNLFFNLKNLPMSLNYDITIVKEKDKNWDEIF